MTIYWDNLPDGYEEVLSELANRAGQYINAPENSEISISFVGPDEIKELNNNHRGIDEVTDVLSFPFTDPAQWDTDLPLALGDIVICTDIAQEQAQLYGHSLKRELGFLFIHGILHLAGYDHIKFEDEEGMREAQREILGELI